MKVKEMSNMLRNAQESLFTIDAALASCERMDQANEDNVLYLSSTDAKDIRQSLIDLVTFINETEVN